MTFNYDCNIDRALRDRANKRWDPDKRGYGFEVSGGDHWKQHGRGRPVNDSIRLLKMHGSVHWSRPQSNGVSLSRDTSEIETLEGSIIPPTWFKDLATFPFGDVWKVARREIRTSRVMLVVGYSVPQTDLFARSLFKVEAGSKEKREKLDLLVLVNPDQRSRQLFIELVRGGLEPSTRVLEYRTFEELDTLLLRNTDGN